MRRSMTFGVEKWDDSAFVKVMQRWTTEDRFDVESSDEETLANELITSVMART